MKKVTRSIFDDNYYRLGAVMLSDKFAKLKQAYQDYYAELGYPLPPTGFANASTYQVWVEKLKTLDTTTTPYQRLLDILNAFELPNTKENVMAMRWTVLFGKSFNEQFPATKGNISSKLTGKNHQELWVRIYPWTKREDYEEYWDRVSSIQRSLVGFRARERYKDAFERDYKVYVMYLETKKHYPNFNTINSIASKMIDLPQYQSLLSEYPDEDIGDQISHIVRRFNRLLLDINFS